MLSGSSDASVAVYDVQQPQDYEGGGLIAKHRPILVIDKQHEQGHKYAVSSAIWYPIDTGLFISGSFDHSIKVWDTNTTQVKMFSFNHHHDMSCRSQIIIYPLLLFLHSATSKLLSGGYELQNAWEGLYHSHVSPGNLSHAHSCWN